MIVETAPAKVNLYLHVGKKGPDGLHELASTFVFTHAGDRILAEPGDGLSLKVTGPFAAALGSMNIRDNLVYRAARRLEQACSPGTGASLVLEKNLPVAAGIGGGSADAAATLRALVKLWDIRISLPELRKLSFGLGADIPACLSGEPVSIGGAGEQISAGPALPPLWVCLVNPGVELSTQAVFKAFDQACPSPPVPAFVPFPERAGLHDSSLYTSLSAALHPARNDLQLPAAGKAPVINDVLEMLRSVPDILCVRMSGSGSTCFALAKSSQDAARAGEKAREKGWWYLVSELRNGR